jgi:hypothetical protein
MKTVSNRSFLCPAKWIRAALYGEDVILRGRSALEYLGLFCGFADEDNIEVFSKEKGIYENVDYTVVESFNHISCQEIRSIMCVTPEFAFNDIMSNFDNAELQPLLEGLATWYFSHDESFDDLYIWPRNRVVFDEIKDWAKHYYDR